MNIFDHINRVKEKPHHVRRQVAFMAAAGATAFVAFAWLATSVTSGIFAIKASNFALSSGAESPAVSTSASDGSGQLAGAAAALDQAVAAPAHIEIIDANPATTTAAQSDQTVIPF